MPRPRMPLLVLPPLPYVSRIVTRRPELASAMLADIPQHNVRRGSRGVSAEDVRAIGPPRTGPADAAFAGRRPSARGRRGGGAGRTGRRVVVRRHAGRVHVGLAA